MHCIAALLLLVSRLGSIEAGTTLGEKYVVTSVQARPDAIHIRVRMPEGDVVTYALDQKTTESGVIELDGARLFYAGHRVRTDSIKRGAELIADALRKSELVGEKLRAAVAERIATARDPWKIEPDVAESILKSLEGTWRRLSGGERSVTRTRAAATVLQDEGLRFIGYDRDSRTFWILSITGGGAVTHLPGVWIPDEQSMEFASPESADGMTHTVVIRIVSPSRHVIEEYLTRRGLPPVLRESSTLERPATP